MTDTKKTKLMFKANRKKKLFWQRKSKRKYVKIRLHKSLQIL